MDHYFLFIFNEYTTEEEEFFFKYIKCVAAYHSDLIAELFHSNFLHNSVYFSSIYLNSNVEEKINWQELIVSETNKLNLYSTTENNEENGKILNNTSLAADCIHNLADQLPFYGSFHLDVLISDQVFQNNNINDHIEFATSLHRLSKWHGAHTTIVTHNTASEEAFREWNDILNAEVLQILDHLINRSVLWRGGIEFKHPSVSTSYSEKFEVRFCPEDDFINRKLQSSTSKDSANKSLVLKPIIQAVEICSFDSIPQHLIYPSVFKLYPDYLEANNNSTKLFDYLNKEKGAALIARLAYSISEEKPKPDKAMCTKKWHKVIASRNVKSPDYSLPDMDCYLSLAITLSSNSEFLVAYFFRNFSSFNSEFYFNIVNFWNTQSADCTLTNRHMDTNESCDVAFIPGDSFHSQLKLVQSSNQNEEKLSLEEGRQFENENALLTSFVSSALSCAQTSVLLDGNLAKTTQEEIDPSDWPERVYLLQKQLEMEEEKKSVGSVFLNLSPQRLHYNVLLSGDDIKKYFSSTGEAKDNHRKAELIQFVKDPAMINKNDLDEVLQKKWPDILNCKYADIYYNVNQQSEEKENIGNEMVRCFIQHETASTCNKHQNIPDAPITLQAKYLTPRKMPKSTKSETSLRQDMMKPNAKMKEKIFQNANVQSNPVLSTIMKAMGVSNASSKELASFSQNRHPRKNSVPVRCSPRKKTTVNYHSSSSRQSSSQLNTKVSNEMPEIIKKKLRVAVASALESNDISMTDPLFRPCFKKLFNICQTFVEDIPRKGSTSQYMKKIADAHVQQVIEFQKQKETRK